MFVLRGERVLLRPGRPEDAAKPVRIRNEPEAARRWGSADIEAKIGEEFVGTKDGLVIEVDGEIVGAIQYSEENEPMCRHAGIDIFLTTYRHSQRLHAEAVLVLARHLFEERDYRRLTIDPAVDNAAAICAYEKAGFSRVGIMRKYERSPDGAWHDGLLMDMLKEDFRHSSNAPIYI